MTNTNMRRGFTMIELIFVIVIIGILAAIAIPKLAGTRTDAKISAEEASAKQALKNLGSEFTAKGAFTDYTAADANAGVNCVTFATTNDGNVTVTPIGGGNPKCPAEVLSEVISDLSGKVLSTTGTARTHSFGGSRIVK